MCTADESMGVQVATAGAPTKTTKAPAKTTAPAKTKAPVKTKAPTKPTKPRKKHDERQQEGRHWVHDGNNIYIYFRKDKEVIKRFASLPVAANAAQVKSYVAEAKKSSVALSLCR